jgi:hypothetical protein
MFGVPSCNTWHGHRLDRQDAIEIARREQAPLEHQLANRPAGRD